MPPVLTKRCGPRGGSRRTAAGSGAGRRSCSGAASSSAAAAAEPHLPSPSRSRPSTPGADGPAWRGPDVPSPRRRARVLPCLQLCRTPPLPRRLRRGCFLCARQGFLFTMRTAAVSTKPLRARLHTTLFVSASPSASITLEQRREEKTKNAPPCSTCTLFVWTIEWSDRCSLGRTTVIIKLLTLAHSRILVQWL